MAEVTEKADSSNYYRILGTNSNASMETIKERYMEKVKAFPPEKDPEEFKRIRKAYETLKNPVKRSLYDLEHKYQGKVKRLMDRASESLDSGELKEAQSQLEEARELAPGNIQLKIFEAHLELVKNNEEGFYGIYDEIEQKSPEREIPDILLSKTQHLKEEGRPGQALKVLKVLEQQYPDKEELYKQFYKDIYYDLNDFNSLWQTLEEMLPAKKEQSLEDVEIFIDRVNAVINFDQWEKEDIVKNEMNEFLDNIINNLDEEKESMLINLLRVEFLEYGMYERYKGQCVYLEFLEKLDDPFLSSEVGDAIRTHALMNQEFNQMWEDMGLFPLVTYRVAELLVDIGVNCEHAERFIDEFSNDLEYMEEMDGEMVAGLIHLQNHYPHTYEIFQDKWDEIYQKRIKKLKPDERKYYTRRIQDRNKSEYEQNREGTIVRKTEKVGRNDPCPCGSGKKYKKCCGR